MQENLGGLPDLSRQSWESEEASVARLCGAGCSEEGCMERFRDLQSPP